MAIGKEGNVKWVDGLRGLASTLVVSTHIARAFYPELFLPAAAAAAAAAPTPLQLPFLRVLVQGRIGVSAFAFVTGYVCALKPLRLSRGGDDDADPGAAAVARSALRRVPRLLLPCALATLASWALGRLGAFAVAARSDCAWCAATGAGAGASSASLLADGLLATWTAARNAFDANQWTLLPLLRGSMHVYVFVLATAAVAPAGRMLLCLALYAYYYAALDGELLGSPPARLPACLPASGVGCGCGCGYISVGGSLLTLGGFPATFGMLFFWGVFLCDLQQHPPATDWLVSRPKMSRLLAFFLLVLGLYIASYPEAHPEWAGWSQQQYQVLVRILPRDADLPRFASGIGLQLITLGLHFSLGLRELLSSRYLLWLGKQSFAVYLLHGPLLRSVLCWMVYGLHVPPDIQDQEGGMVRGKLIFPGGRRLLLCLPFWIPLNYGAAMLWTGYVDPWCNQLTEKLVSYVTAGDGEKDVVLPL
ncbi:acyltransferase family-domain-containing protein [Xylariomycetidae sp. FL0641]|nr:acyltransferase family-domain-containing protein [Xylariomycetidae sp. FL0641]